MYVLPTLSALELTLRDLGHAAEAGAGVAAAQAVFSARTRVIVVPDDFPSVFQGSAGPRARQERSARCACSPSAAPTTRPS